jgi:hypothetical protein
MIFVLLVSLSRELMMKIMMMMMLMMLMSIFVFHWVNFE